MIKHGPPPRLTFRQVIDHVLMISRKESGKQTARDYLSRLVPAIEYAEQPEVRRRWPWVAMIDGSSEFALGLREFLLSRTVTRNGHAASEPRRVSARQVHNILSTTATALNLAKRPEHNLLSSAFVNPLTRKIIGERAHRDPLAPPKLPMDVRTAMVGVMDAWQLSTLCWPLVEPNRPDELAGVLISDVHRGAREIVFAPRWGGDDGNKAHQAFRTVYPEQFDPIVEFLTGGRTAGPLLRRRTVAEQQRQPEITVNSEAELQREFDRMLNHARPDEVQCLQDRKRVFRRLLRRLGGADEDDLAKEFHRALTLARPDLSVRFYDLRGSVTTDLKRAGVEEILRRYTTGHSVNRNIMAEYESQDLHADMERYFQYIAPLLTAIQQRAKELGISSGRTDATAFAAKA
ncbi:MAG: hypothetical protein K8T25_17675 [Planctomycetia bacterium]|nr:hypothetical protein [Planctomycetia bacterium]